MNIAFTTVFTSIFSAGSLSAQSPIIYEGQTMDVIVPENPLASNSLQIMPKGDMENVHETYDLLRRIVQIWEKRGVHDYMIFGKHTPNHPFHWEIVPFPKEGFRFWKRFSVLWNMTFGSSRLSDKDRNAIAENYRKEFPLSYESNPEPAEVIGNDPFCNQEVIDRQLVFEGNEVRVLYNHAPIVLGEGLHFLIVPKQHKTRFSDLSETEYLEAMQWVQRLVEYYRNKGYPIAYIFDKTGTEAGQTVPHWHEHVVFAATENEELLAKLTVLKNMIFYGSPLPRNELKARVESLRKEPVFSRD
jgi:diadenosine tetraphosphate (Ap4A) HIT family hydrolase